MEENHQLVSSVHAKIQYQFTLYRLQCLFIDFLNSSVSSLQSLNERLNNSIINQLTTESTFMFVGKQIIWFEVQET